VKNTFLSIRLCQKEVYLLVAKRLARDVLVGNDFTEKAGVRLVRDRVETYEPVGELFHL